MRLENNVPTQQKFEFGDRLLNRRLFLKRLLGASLGLATTGYAGYAYAKYIEPHWVDVTHLSLQLSHLSKSFDHYRLVQISDLHLDRGLNAERLLPIIQLVNNQKPDLVVITGDFVNGVRYLKEAVPVFQQIKSQDGVFGILGNHDYWADFAPQVREILVTCHVQELYNQVKTIHRGQDQLHLAGVDDILEGEPDLNRVINQLPTEGSAILLAHEPDYADVSAATDRFDLQLSGHTHGGQVSLPIYGPPITSELGKKYPVGLYQIERMKLYTNRGLGVLPRIRVRFNARPEITVFTLFGQ